jgi:hypothetical protein
MADTARIYGLADPRTGEVRYVGRTIQSLRDRLLHHLSHAHRQQTYVHRWIVSLGNNRPAIFELEAVPKDECADAEIFWISYLRGLGARLANLTDGGEGSLNPSAECRAKLSAAGKRRRGLKSGRPAWNKGIPLSEAQREAVRRFHTGRRHSDETRAKMSAAHRTPEAIERSRRSMLGRRWSAQHRENIHAAFRSKSPEAENARRLLISKAQRGRVLSQETRARMSVAKKGIPLSDEHRAKLAAAHRGIPLSEQHRASLSESGRIAWKTTRRR